MGSFGDGSEGLVVRSPSLGVLGTGDSLREAEVDGLGRVARLIRRQIAGLHLIYASAEAERVVGDDEANWAEGSVGGEDLASAETARLLSGVVRELNVAARRLDELAELVAIADPDDRPLGAGGGRKGSVRGTRVEDPLERPATGWDAVRWPHIAAK
jgi:hypothetical protein